MKMRQILMTLLGLALACGVVYAAATIDLLYQPTSYEYQLFLLKANRGANPFLAEEGANMFEAWLNTGMASPYVMVSTTWREPGLPL
jgi:hypothetical protein